MRLRRISQDTTYHIEKATIHSKIVSRISVLCALGIVSFTLLHFFPQNTYTLFLIPLAFILIALKFSSHKHLLNEANIYASWTEFPEYIEIDSQGIHVEYYINSNFENILLEWNELNEVMDMDMDLSFLNNKRRVVHFAIISAVKKQEATQALNQTYINPIKHIRKLKKEIEIIEQKEKPQPKAIIVEMYDEMAAEIKKYWKKQD